MVGAEGGGDRQSWSEPSTAEDVVGASAAKEVVGVVAAEGGGRDDGPRRRWSPEVGGGGGREWWCGGDVPIQAEVRRRLDHGSWGLGMWLVVGVVELFLVVGWFFL